MEKRSGYQSVCGNLPASLASLPSYSPKHPQFGSKMIVFVSVPWLWNLDIMLVRAAAGKVRAQSRSKFDVEHDNGEHGTGCLSSSAAGGALGSRSLLIHITGGLFGLG